MLSLSTKINNNNNLYLAKLSHTNILQYKIVYKQQNKIIFKRNNLQNSVFHLCESTYALY